MTSAQQPAGTSGIAAFLRAGRPPQARRLVVCAGDSITRGQSSANWVDILQRRFAARGTSSLRDIAAAHAADYLPLHDRLASLLPSPHNPLPYRGRFGPMIKASLSHTILHRSWDQISAANGLIVLIDHVHLNDRAAVLTADLVADFITGS